MLFKIGFTIQMWAKFLDLQRRCPQGKKTILYKQAKYEIFAEYLMQDGMVARLTEYADSARM